jgi:hypothetical protein
MPDKEKDITWLVDIFKTLGAVAGSLTSLGVLFVVIGYTIVLSFIQEMKLYGLADFPREFFMEADLKFFSEHFILGPSISIFFLFLFLLIVIYNQRNRNLKWVLLGLTITLILITSKLAKFPENIQKFILYSVSIPLFVALIVYLVLNVRQLARLGGLRENSYLFFIILFLLLVLSIPISYGRNIYDLNVYSINAFEYDSKYENDSMKEMRDNIAKGGGELYYIMGHTAGKQIFFIASSTPKEMIIIDREAVKFLGIIRNESGRPQTLRWILAPAATPSPPEQIEKTGKEISKEEKKEYEALFD